MNRSNIEILLTEYSLDEILEMASVEEIDALRFLVARGIVNLADVPVPVDARMADA
jgi:hypothetical protein